MTLRAGQTLTVRADEAPGEPEEPGVDALSAEPFIAKNLELDREKEQEGDQNDSDDPEDDERGGSGDGSPLNGTYTGTLVTTEAFSYGSGGPIQENLGNTSEATIFIDCLGDDCFVEYGSVHTLAGVDSWTLDGNTLRGEGRRPTPGGDPSCGPQEDITEIELIVDSDGRMTGRFLVDRVPGSVPCGDGGSRSGARYVYEFTGQRDAQGPDAPNEDQGPDGPTAQPGTVQPNGARTMGGG